MTRVTAISESQTVDLIEITADEMSALVKKNGPICGEPVYFVDAYGPDGVLVWPTPSAGWKILPPWRHVSFDLGPGGSASADEKAASGVRG